MPLNIDNPYFEGMVNQIYPPELQLNKANTTYTENPFLDLHLFIANGFVTSKNYHACLVFNPIMVDNYAAFYNCTPVGRASDSMMAPT